MKHSSSVQKNGNRSELEVGLLHGSTSESDLYMDDHVTEANVPCCRRFETAITGIIPYGGALSSTFNLASATLGAGVISIPAAFNMSGIVTSMVLLLAVTVGTIYSVYLLIAAGEKSGYWSYEAMSKNLLGSKWDYATSFMLWLFAFGTCVGYVIAIGDLLQPIFRDIAAPHFFHTDEGNALATSIIWLVGMLSLSLPKHINSLRYASTLAVCVIILFIVCIIVHCVRYGFVDGHMRSDVFLFRADNRAIEGLSLFMFAYLCQINCFEIYREMQSPSVGKMTRHTTYSMSLCCAAYMLAGFFGYAEFGSKLTGGILQYYDLHGDVLLWISYIGIVLKLCVGFALCIQPARDTCYYCMGWDVETVPAWKNMLFCGSMSFLALVLGLVIPSINIVFGLMGSLCGGFLGFILPALFIMYCGDWSVSTVGIGNYLATYVLLLSGVVAVVFGTGASIYGLIQDHINSE